MAVCQRKLENFLHDWDDLREVLRKELKDAELRLADKPLDQGYGCYWEGRKDAIEFIMKYAHIKK